MNEDEPNEGLNEMEHLEIRAACAEAAAQLARKLPNSRIIVMVHRGDKKAIYNNGYDSTGELLNSLMEHVSVVFEQYGLSFSAIPLPDIGGDE